MPIHPAISPTRAFVCELVALSYDFQDDIPGGLQVGDVVEAYDDGRRGTVTAVDAQVATLVDEAGQPFQLPVDDSDGYYLADRPSLEGIWERHLRNSPPEGVAIASELPDDLRDRLVAGFEVLRAGPVDYHPGSGAVVRDLVHPSLYPLVRQEKAPAPEPAAEKPDFFARLLGRRPPPPPAPPPPGPSHDRWGRPFEDSIYQWLPTRVAIDDDGRVAFVGPINNLPADAHGPMIQALGDLLSHLLPLFESVCGYAEGLTVYSEDLEGEHELSDPGAEPVPAEPATPRSLRGSTVQVITKIVEYRLEEGEEFDGVWHVEGMSHEHILATGVCTVGRDPGLVGGDLRFKRACTQEEAGALFWNIAQIRPETIERIAEEGYVPLGTMPTRAGECFVFPNSHVHKLSTLSSAGGTSTRQVIVFWLIDPEHTLPGMEDVALPQSTMTHAEALEVRLALMEERRVHKQSHNVRTVSLCEH